MALAATRHTALIATHRIDHGKKIGRSMSGH
jgi:hypothetical protein